MSTAGAFLLSEPGGTCQACNEWGGIAVEEVLSKGQWYWLVGALCAPALWRKLNVSQSRLIPSEASFDQIDS